jgi:GH25 family lysozyme M1 (1,4-beta-N-acetylmuramidase)
VLAVTRHPERPARSGSRALRAAALVGLGACATQPALDVAQSQAELCVGGTYVEGVDISSYQAPPINWAAVKPVAGAFAFAKASEGTAIADAAFPSHWPAIRAAGITRGAYHYFKGTVDGVAQANHYLNVIASRGGFQIGDLPAAVDVEHNPNPVFSSLTGNVASDLARLRATLNQLEAQTGRKPIIYTNNNTWSQLGNPSGFEAYPVWLANWGATCTALPPGLTNLKFWQYNVGTAPGISGQVDRDRFNGTAADLAAFAGGAPGGGATTCDNNVPVNGTACNPADPGAQFVCTMPGLPSAQQWTRQLCGGGQSCVGTRCQGGAPACGSGLFCAGNAIPGASACASGSQTLFCCPSGQTIVNGACASATPPPCGSGLFCALNAIPGASRCLSGTTPVFCCAPGRTIVNGVCSP